MNFTADKTKLEISESLTLEWNVKNAEICEAYGSWDGELELEGQAFERPGSIGNYVYGLDCSNRLHKEEQEINVQVVQPIILDMYLNLEKNIFSRNEQVRLR